MLALQAQALPPPCWPVPQDTSAAQAELIEYNAEAVDAALKAVKAALARGLSWRELEELIKVLSVLPSSNAMLLKQSVCIRAQLSKGG